MRDQEFPTIQFSLLLNNLHYKFAGLISMHESESFEI